MIYQTVLLLQCFKCETYQIYHWSLAEKKTTKKKQTSHTHTHKGGAGALCIYSKSENTSFILSRDSADVNSGVFFICPMSSDPQESTQTTVLNAFMNTPSLTCEITTKEHMQSPSRQDLKKIKNKAKILQLPTLHTLIKTKKRLDSKLRYIMDVVELRKALTTQQML